MAAEVNSVPIDIQEKMKQYRAALLAFGMREPTRWRSLPWHWCFYKPATELTAFVVNLRANEFYIEATYGYASTSFTQMAGDENSLLEMGVSDGEITLREKLLICDEPDEAAAKGRIAQMYSAYLHTPKDALLLCAKEKRKAFLQEIHERLKPLGFRKKGNTWFRALEDTYNLVFNAQKSAFSDEYYFNVYIGKGTTAVYGGCYDVRIGPKDMQPMDWQALTSEKFAFFLDKTVMPELEKILHTPLPQLGQLPSYWLGCHCNRRKCERCWMQKNLWEARA